MDWIVFAIVMGAVTIVIAALVVGVLYEKNRTRELSTYAESLGMDFLGEDRSLFPRVRELLRLWRGRAEKIWNVMEGGSDDEQLYVFDYRYTVGSGKNSQTHKQTVVFFESVYLDLPPFVLYPERWYHKIGQVLGMKDVNFPQYPAFSKRYVLRGNEQRLLAEFKAPLIQKLEELSGVSMAGQGTRMIVFYHRRRSKPHQIKNLLETAYALYTAARSTET